MTPNEYRTTYRSADQRLLDGLVLFAIVATIYPRASDLERSRDEAPQPTTVQEIEETLRNLAETWEERAEGEGKVDPAVEDIQQGLEEAWRVYKRRVSTDKTESSKSSHRSTRSFIEHGLDVLREQGLMTKNQNPEPTRYRPTWRFNALVQEQGAARMYRVIRDALEQGASDGARETSPPTS